MDVPPGEIVQGPEKVQGSVLKFCDRVLHIQSGFRGHQIIATAPGAKFSGRRANFPDQPRFHPGVNVFTGFASRPLGMTFHMTANLFQAANQASDFAGSQYSRPPQDSYVGLVDAKIVKNPALVEGKRLGIFLKEHVALVMSEAATPQLHFALLRARAAPRLNNCFLAAASFTGSPRMLIKPSASFWS